MSEFNKEAVKEKLMGLFSEQIDGYGYEFLKDLKDSWDENHMNVDEKNNKGLVKLTIKADLIMEDENEVGVNKLTTSWDKTKKVKKEPISMLINSAGDMFDTSDD